MPRPKPLRQLLRNTTLSFFSGVSGWLRKSGVPVLGYHSVGHVDSHINIRPDIFTVHMEVLREYGYRGVSLKTLIDLVEAGERLPDDIVVLTFDDGLRNFREHAWPVLSKCGFSATNFVATDFVGGKAEWYASCRLDPLPVMGWDELRDLRRAGADIQSHGCSHRRLKELSSDELRREAALSRSLLEKQLGETVDLYCYPFGDVSRHCARAVKEAGYRAAVTVKHGLYGKGQDLFRIRRQILDYITISDETTARLSIRACLNGGYGNYVATRNALKCLRFRGSYEN